MDVLKLLRGFLTTTWTVYLILTILLTFSDPAFIWIPTAAYLLITPCIFPRTLVLCLVIWIKLTMSFAKKCCVPNCNKTRDEDTILHLFPNPMKEMDRFKLWMDAIGGEILFLDNQTVFQCRRVCHLHFESQYYTRSKRLSAAAVPTLHLQDLGVLPKEAQDTADVIIFFDKLFDSQNGSYENWKKRSGKPLLGPVTPHSDHRFLWQEAKKVLGSMKFIDENNTKSGTVPSLKNWLHTIENTFKYMVEKLTEKYGLTSLWMRHFNQDPLENFFGCIRSHGYRNVSPTCAGFEAAFASLLINNMSSMHSKGSNCEVDTCTVFKSFNKLFFKKPEMSGHTVEIDFDDVIGDYIIDIELKIGNPKIKAQLEYVTGYVLRKLKVRDCNKCKECFYSSSNEEHIIFIKEYLKNKRLLTYPSRALVKCFSQMQDVVINIIRKNCTKPYIRHYIKTVFSVVLNYNFIKCDIHNSEIIDNLENLAINIFLYNWCKDTNKILSGSRSDFDEDDPLQKLAYNHYRKRNKRIN